MPINVSDAAFPSTSSASMINPAKPRIEVMLIIFFASLFAVSFPTLSKQIPIFRIPAIVFFIGRHFGTGVILATAFIHLLDDAFRSLQNPLIRIQYGNIGKWTGLIILGSLLIIFLVEYTSDCYVDYLQSKPSPPTSTALPSRPASLKSLSRSSSRQDLTRPTTPQRPQQTILTSTELARPMLNTETTLLTETTPLLSTQPEIDTSFSLLGLRREISVPNIHSTNESLHSRDHSPRRYHHHHAHHICPNPIPPAAVKGVPINILTNSPQIFRQLRSGHSHPGGHVGHAAKQAIEGGMYPHDHHKQIGQRRQIVGVLVLQLGIMIHSLVIGLTLAVTDGSDFTSLTTAILFHQLFEGLSLGIRIAALSPKVVKESHIAHGDDESLSSSMPPIMPSLHSDFGVPSNSTSSSGHRCCGDLEIREGRIEVSDRYLWAFRGRRVHWLEPTLSILFALTTPFGMGIGMILWKERDGSDPIQMLLIKGTMSAISAGMLIYAATVEMIAGDFVFGDVDGGHGHGHKPYPDPHERSGRPCSRSDNHDIPEPEDGKEHQEEQWKLEKTTTAMKVLAVLSLFAGAAGMVLMDRGN